MSGHKTHEQVREEHNEVLGPVLGPLYHGLYEEVTWLHENGSSTEFCSRNHQNGLTY